MRVSVAGLWLYCCFLPACSGDGQAAELAGKRVEASSAGTVALGLRAVDYRPMAVGTTGSIAGTVSLDSIVLRDSVVAVTQNQGLCGDSATVSEASVSNVLVWIDGVAAGKRLPEVRRDAITIERCRFSPRVLGVIAGTTINVKSRDRAVMTSRFFRENVGEPVAEVHTVDAGQVVPSEQIASKAGIVEIRTMQQPWSRGFIAVFDHPYFAVTDERGVFSIDSLPAGTYTVKAWHERMDAPVEQRVVVGTDGRAQLEFRLK